MSTSHQNRYAQDNVYFNVEFLNNNNIPNQLMIYDTTLNESIVDNSINYYLTVVDFAIPLTSVPIMIAPLQTGSLTNTTMSITFVVNGIPMTSQTVIFTPERTDPFHYTYIYDYNTMINMLNNTLRACYNAFIGTPAYAGYVQANVNVPFFIYDSATELITLVTDISYATNIPQVNTVVISINDDLLNYLNGFSFQYVFRDVVGVRTPFYDFNIYTDGSNRFQSNLLYPTPLVSPAYITTIQSYNNMANWSDLKKVIIVSNSLPIAGESILRGVTSSNITNNQYVLSSFTPEVIKTGDQRSIIYYNPASQYRLIDITSDTDIRRIDITVYWEDFNNNWYNMELLPNSNATIRLAFVKKDLYKSNLLKKM
jgi:hypothetical protein